jgi:2-phosphosulfolactate phosphatase
VHFEQAEYDLKREWGLDGLLALQETSDVVVIVDVLSFSTAVDIAVSKGASVFPYRWDDYSASQFAAEKHAELAAERRTLGKYTLSPASLGSIPPGTLLVLPSPNGSALSLSTNGLPAFTACLRNAPAVGRRAASRGRRVAVIPAGERNDGALRPCLEDLIGAGAVLANLPGTLSPEAEMAVATFTHFHKHLRETLLRCASGRELVEKGFALDVELASEYGVSEAAPVLTEDRFIDDSVSHSPGLTPQGSPAAGQNA